MKHILCTILILLLPLSLNAQSPKKPKDLFGGDFVTKGMNTKKDLAPPKVQKKIDRKKTTNPLALSVTIPPQEQTNTKDAQEFSYLDEPGIPIKSIGVIINARDRAHFSKHVGNLVHIASTFDLIVSQVAAIGMFVPGKENPLMSGLYFSPQSLALIALQGQMAPYLSMPRDLDIERSPTWVFNTAEGTVLLDGIDAFWLFLNRKGEFIDRDPDEVAKQIAPVVDTLVTEEAPSETIKDQKPLLKHSPKEMFSSP